MKNTPHDSPSVNRESDKFMLRLPDGMRNKIAEVAKSHQRSMNAEIVARLERSFEAEQLGFSHDSLDVLGLQALLAQLLLSTLDQANMNEAQRQLFAQLDVVSRRISSHIQLGKTASVFDATPPEQS